MSVTLTKVISLKARVRVDAAPPPLRWMRGQIHPYYPEMSRITGSHAFHRVNGYPGANPKRELNSTEYATRAEIARTWLIM